MPETVSTEALFAEASRLTQLANTKAIAHARAMARVRQAEDQMIEAAKNADTTSRLQGEESAHYSSAATQAATARRNYEEAKIAYAIAEDEAAVAAQEADHAWAKHREVKKR